ncbi:rubredoxin [Pseudomonas glycinae]|uniref:rubredoxin n=1 Tax=Pseudomonas glycinae TaxID=1785145 RepID=UPI0018D6F5F6|nr:rubredoxin [Pseudomonas glycinae]MBH3404285.1 rubredoxin [Pseudomonas glycinae]
MSTQDTIKTCTVCGYEYDPTVGDPQNGIAAGTPWDDVHDDWLCPDCQMPKEDFE